MDGFEWNKVLKAILFALLVGMFSGKIGDFLVHPLVTKKGLIIEGVDEETPVHAAESQEAEPLEPLLMKASFENGEKISKKCLQCHTLDKGGAQKIGPNLYGIVGQKFGHVDGFPYSSALKEKSSQGMIWSVDHLNHFLYKPSKFIPNTKMSFIGIKKAQERADLITFLNKNSDKPLSLTKQ